MAALLKKLKDRWWQIALAIGGLAVLAFLFVCFVDSSEELTAWQFFTVIAASVGIYVAYRRAKAMEDTAKAGHDANEQKAYNEAVANLGNKNPSVRLGGIYGLFDLAQSNRSKSRNITEILCAHLRETTQRKSYQKDNNLQPSNEIQSLLDVLCELNEGNLAHKESSNIRLDLQQSYLRGANLEGKNLCTAQLRKAELRGAILWMAKLQGAYLWDVQLQGAILFGAKLHGASLCRARLQGADLYGAELQGADLFGAKLQGASLGRAELQGADLYGAELQGTIDSGGVIVKPFDERINERTDKNTHLKNVVFRGGLTDAKITEIQNVLFQLAQDGLYDKGEADKLCAHLRKHHLGNPPSHEPPKGAETGVLTKEMADKIIADYNKSLGD